MLDRDGASWCPLPGLNTLLYDSWGELTHQQLSILHCLPPRWLRQSLPFLSSFTVGFSEWTKSVLAISSVECRSINLPSILAPQVRAWHNTSGIHTLYGILKLALLTRDVYFLTTAVVSPVFGIWHFS